MGGGKKKLTLKQMARVQKGKGRERKERKMGRSTAVKEKSLRITIPNARDEKIINEVKKIKVLTPYEVATRFNIRLSLAKSFLKELRRRGIIEYVSGSKNLKIYKPSE